MVVCKNCGKEIAEGRKFCSRECFQQYQRETKGGFKASNSHEVARKGVDAAQGMFKEVVEPVGVIRDDSWCWCEGYQELIRAAHCRRRRGGAVPMAPWIKKYCYSCKGKRLRLATEVEIEKHKNAPDQGDRRRGAVAGV